MFLLCLFRSGASARERDEEFLYRQAEIKSTLTYRLCRQSFFTAHEHHAIMPTVDVMEALGLRLILLVRELTSVVPRQLSWTAGTQQIDRAWQEMNNFIPTTTHLPRKAKLKGSSVHNPAIERRVWQCAWRRELKESAPKDVLDASGPRQWPIKSHIDEHERFLSL